MNEYEETWTYKFCNFSDLPVELETQVYDLVNSDALIKIDYNKNLNKEYIKNGEIKKSLALYQYESSNSINDWVYENIANLGVTNIRCSKSGGNGDKEKRDFRGPHTDSQRNYTLMYLLENGGNNVETAFYHENGETIVRDNALAPTNMDSMIELDRVNIPLRRWIVLNSRILHTVENIETDRISLQIGLSTVRGIKHTFIN